MINVRYSYRRSLSQPAKLQRRKLKSVHEALERLYTALRGTDKHAVAFGGENFVIAFSEAMDDDFNTPNALSVLFEMAREVNKLKAEDMAKANALAARLRELANILGLLEQDPEDFYKQAQR